MSTPSLADLFRTFGKIGLLSFGGPAGQIALMHRILVDEKKWLGERQFLNALNFCMLLPGPEAMQLATYSGWLMHGVRGGLVAGLLFIVPGALVMLALSAAYIFLGDQSWMVGLLFGLKAAVLAVVLEAMIRVSRRALTGSFAYGIATIAFVGIAFLKLPFPLIIFCAAALGAIRHFLLHGSVAKFTAVQSKIDGETTHYRSTFGTIFIWLGLWLLPLAAIIWFDFAGDFFKDASLFFSKAAIVTFGGAYAVLVYAGQQAVEVYGWLRPDEMVTALGLAETTPGPLILVLVFVAFIGGSRVGGLDPLAGGALGGLTALWFTFVPCFLWVFAGAPYIEAAGRVKWLSAALSAVTAAVVGVIANLTLWFGLHVLFGAFVERTYGPLHLPVLEWGTFDWRSAVIAVLSAVALLKLRVNLLAVIVIAACAGIMLVLIGG